jgi:acetaldehyde dehydrogenase (acetylating)
VVVNTPTTHGSIGLTTGLDPALTLGCGGYGGNITSDNISPMHLLNIKRLAYELEPAVVTTDSDAVPVLPRPPPRRAPRPTVARLAPDLLAHRIDQFLASRGYTPGEHVGRTNAARPVGHVTPPPAEKPAEFVCEEDVRQALRASRRILLGDRSIVTPAARDLGEQHQVFIQASWPR